MAGHPIHLMIVHFPAALYPFSIALDWTASVTNNASFSTSAYYSLWAAIVTSGLAAVFGTIDLLRIDPKGTAWNTSLLHGGLNVLWLLCFATMLGIRMKGGPLLIQGSGYLITSTLFVVGLFYSNFLGGELVLKHGVGRKNQ